MRRLRALLVHPVIAILIVTALGGIVRTWQLGRPTELVFDEVYYPKSGCILIGGSDEYCRVDSNDEKYWRREKWDVGSWVHPPLGKWQIGLGIKALGMDPTGWRSATAVAGTLVVTLTAFLAWLLFASVAWTYAAGLLMAVEHLSVVLSRTGLLDMHLVLWGLAGMVLLVLDRRWIEKRQRRVDAAEADRDPAPRVLSPVWRPWRFAAGAAFGAATAVKWSGAMALAAALLLTLVWEVSRRHRHGVSWSRALGRACAREALGVVLALLLVPAAVHVATWLPWLHHFDWDWAKWWDTQKGSYRFHFQGGIDEFKTDPNSGSLVPTHPYYARPWGWLILWRPISFYFKDIGPEMKHILAIGNPMIFWASTIAIVYLPVAWRRLRDWRAGFLFLTIAGLYLPWYRVDRPTFFFYVAPLVPFLVLAVVYGLRHLSDAFLVVREPDGSVAVHPDTGEPAISTAYIYRPFVWIYLAAAVLVFMWFWPVLTAEQISDLRYPTIVWFPGWI
jgi:dolichyl-phosphate-mannose--protein O-mannosyl transferase